MAAIHGSARNTVSVVAQSGVFTSSGSDNLCGASSHKHRVVVMLQPGVELAGHARHAHVIGRYRTVALQYGIPDANPFRSTADALPEIFAYGIRNAQRFGWDSRSGAMYLSDIGQNTVEEVSPVTAGANLGWNVWEGSYRFRGRQGVTPDSPRADPKLTYPIVEWDQLDPVLLPTNSSGAVGALIYRSTRVPQLTGRLLFGDMPSGELFHVSADDLPTGGQDAVRRVLFRTEAGAAPRRLLEIIQEKNRAQGRPVATRADMRFDVNAAGQIFVLNKADGTIRVIER